MKFCPRQLMEEVSKGAQAQGCRFRKVHGHCKLLGKMVGLLPVLIPEVSLSLDGQVNKKI